MPNAFSIAKPLQQEYSQILNGIIKIVNSIKEKALQSRLFMKIWGIPSKFALSHKCKVLNRVMKLWAELLVYLQQVTSDYSELISDSEFRSKLAILSNLFEHLNYLNKNVQGWNENVITAKDKHKDFKK